MSADVRLPMRQWAQGAIQRAERRLNRARRGQGGARAQRRGLLLVHLDGVPRSLLREAVEQGTMPFLSRLIKGGSYSLDEAFWGSPASTPAFQAGVLYGLRHPNLPAYWWYDRELGREVGMNRPKDTLEIDRRLGAMSSERLLEKGGTSYLTLFRAGAENRLCMSSLAEKGELLKAIPRTFRGVRASKREPLRRGVRSIVADVIESTRDVWRWTREIGDWRHEKEYLLNRFFLVSLGWNLSCARTVLDMVGGAPSIYLVYGNYDEVAHRRGPFSPQAIEELHRVDADLEALHAVGQTLTPGFDMHLVTDHGHVDSTPFERRTGQRLRHYLLEGPPVPLSADVRGALLDGRAELQARDERELSEPVVVESGNFSHVYLSRRREPLEARELIAEHAGVLARAASSPQIGIVVVRRADEAVALIAGALYRADEVANAPLAPGFSRRALADLLREVPHMPSAGDLILFGDAALENGTVGFAWEFGSHGGLTHIETDSTIIWPRSSPVAMEGLGHSTELYERLSEAYRS